MAATLAVLVPIVVVSGCDGNVLHMTPTSRLSCAGCGLGRNWLSALAEFCGSFALSLSRDTGLMRCGVNGRVDSVDVDMPADV